MAGGRGGGRGSWGMGCRGARGPEPPSCAPPPGRSPPPAAPLRPRLCLSPPRCALGASPAPWPGLPRSTRRWGYPPGKGSGPPGFCPGLLPLLSVRLGLPRPGEGAGSGLCLPPHAPPRGPDSGVRGRTGDARPVYPPRAASAPTGGAARAGEGEGSPPRPCDLPWALHPGTQDPQSLLPQTHQSCLSSLLPPAPRCLLPGPGRPEPVAR